MSECIYFTHLNYGILSPSPFQNNPSHLSLTETCSPTCRCCSSKEVLLQLLHALQQFNLNKSQTILMYGSESSSWIQPDFCLSNFAVKPFSTEVVELLIYIIPSFYLYMKIDYSVSSGMCHLSGTVQNVTETRRRKGES